MTHASVTAVALRHAMRLGLPAGASLAFSTAAGAQPCDPSWSPLGSGVNSVVRSMILFDDDGPGPDPDALIVGGFFRTAGGMPANRVARWDGESWSTLGLGTNSQVSALAVFDEDGPGSNPPLLFAGGFFTTAGTVIANHVARWNGQEWSSVDSGVGQFRDDTVTSLAVFDADDEGLMPAVLVVGGFFINAGEVLAENIAQWDGKSWAPLESGTNGTITGLAVYDPDDAGPTPPVLLVGGAFSMAGGVPARSLAQWDGQAWSEFGGGANASVADIVVLDEERPGGEPLVLYAAGAFTEIGGVAANGVARWDGQTCSALDNGANFTVAALEAFDEDGQGPAAPALHAGGFIIAGGEVLNQVARWDGASWAALDGGFDSLVGELFAVSPGLMGQPPTLYAGGFFSTVGGVPASRIAGWVGCLAPECAPDWNGDGVVNSNDFFLFLEDFFGAGADFNGDGATNSDDVFAFLAAYFEGC